MRSIALGSAHAALLLTLVGCGESGDPTAEPKVDAARDVDADSTSNPQDGGLSSDAAGDAIKTMPQSLILLNAAGPSLAPFVFCLDTSGKPVPRGTPMPASNYAGVAPGAGVGVPLDLEPNMVKSLGGSTGSPFNLYDGRRVFDRNASLMSCSDLSTVTEAMLGRGKLSEPMGDSINVVAVTDVTNGQANATVISAKPVMQSWVFVNASTETLPCRFTGNAGGTATPSGDVEKGKAAWIAPLTSSLTDRSIDVTCGGSPSKRFTLADIEQATDPTAAPGALYPANATYVFFFTGSLASVPTRPAKMTVLPFVSKAN